jgi:CRP-like cAMP-binding protein
MIFFELFSNHPHIINIDAGQSLFNEGDDGHKMYVLTTGEAEVIVNNRVVDRLQHGNLVGEMSLISPGPRSASVLATTNCQFVAIDEKRFLFLVQQAPYFATQVMRTLAERLRNTNKLVPAIEDI